MRYFIMFLFIFSTAIYANVGKITAYKGKATIFRDSKFLIPKIGFIIEKNDKITTKKDTRIQILFKDSTILSLGKNTSFSISDYFYDELQPKKTNASFKFTKGVFKAITGKIALINPKNFKLKTRTASIGIRGTTFFGEIKEDGKENISCTYGAISVTTPQGMVDVDAGEFTIVEFNKPPTPPVKLSSKQRKSLESKSGAQLNEQESKKDAKSVGLDKLSQEMLSLDNHFDAIEDNEDGLDKVEDISNENIDLNRDSKSDDNTYLNESEVSEDEIDTNLPVKEEVEAQIKTGLVTWRGYATDTALDSNNKTKSGNSGIPIADNTYITFQDGKIDHIRTSADGDPVYTKETDSVSGSENHTEGKFKVTDGTTTWTSYGSYNYTYWGYWESPNATDIYDIKKAYWIVGQTTTDIPTQGSALYKGVIKGSEFYADHYVDDLTGTTNINIDFTNNNKVTGDMTINRVSDGSNFATVNIGGEMGTDGVITEAQLSGNNVESWSKLNARLNGPQAQELGGFWWINKDDGHLGQGIVSAKKE